MSGLRVPLPHEGNKPVDKANIRRKGELRSFHRVGQHIDLLGNPLRLIACPFQLQVMQGLYVILHTILHFEHLLFGKRV